MQLGYLEGWLPWQRFVVVDRCPLFRGGGGYCPGPKHPQRGMKSSGQQQQTSGRRPASSYMEGPWSYKASEGIFSEIAGGDEKLFGGKRKFCSAVKDNIRFRSNARDSTGLMRSSSPYRPRGALIFPWYRRKNKEKKRKNTRTKQNKTKEKKTRNKV